MKSLVKISLLLCVVFAPLASAETMQNTTVLMSGTQTASTNGTVYPKQVKKWAARLTWANTAGTNPTLDVKIQHCPTATTTTCDDVESFGQKTTTSGKETIHLDSDSFNPFPYWRAVSTIGGTDTPTYTVKVELFSYY